MYVILGYSRDPYLVSLLREHGIKAWTCDLRPADHEYHLQGDIWDFLGWDWDFALLHPTCTYLTCAAAWAYGDGPYHMKLKPGTLVGAERRAARDADLENFRRLLDLDIPHVAIENPATSYINTAIRPPDQKFHPYQFGVDASKNTGLWLKGLDPLTPTERVPGRMVEHPKGSGKMVERWSNQTDSGQNKLAPSDDRWAERSKFGDGIHNAIADQWIFPLAGTRRKP